MAARARLHQSRVEGDLTTTGASHSCRKAPRSVRDSEPRPAPRPPLAVAHRALEQVTRRLAALVISNEELLHVAKANKKLVAQDKERGGQGGAPHS
jgi:hypothetical protein